ncbi:MULTISPECIES: hypothetical protein [unclassified Kitasatospora]|uniref:hypothetical protein n=1 Tax=unclassified Kitasatospora TaxID=2633591 RepID=UPI0037FFD3DA
MTTNQPGGHVLSEALRAIAADAGFAIIDTAGTDLWPPFRYQVASWLAQDGGQAERSELARLAETAAALRAAGDAEARSIAARHAVVWQDRFIALLEQLGTAERDPAAARLQRLVRDHSTGNTGATTGPGVITGQNVRIQADRSSLAAGMVNGDVHIGFPPIPDPSRG